MSFFSTVIGKAASLFPRVVQASLPSGTLEIMKRYGKMPDISQDALCRKYFGWVYCCAQVSAQRFASTPLKLYASRAKGQSVVKNFAARKVDKAQSAWLKKRIGKSLPQVAGAEDFEELEEHPLLDLLQNVNDQENSYEMKLLTSTMLDLTGDSYWYIERDKMGVPDKMFVLRSQWVKIVPDKDKFIGEYIYGVSQFGQEELHIPAENVIHFKYPNPTDPWYGMGPVQAAAYAIESAELREKFILATMGNMARPDIIVKYLEGELDPKERGLLEREWNAMFRGPKNAGKVKVTDFRYEIDKVGWTPQELRFNEGEDWILKKIAGAFPVPIGLIDTAQISRAPRAGMEGADLFMAQFNTLPRCTLIEEKLNEQLCPMYDGERLFLAFDNPVPKDKREQLNEDSTKLNTCVITVNEVRQRDGEEPVPWGDTPIPLQQAQAAAQQFAPLGGSPSSSAEGAGAGNNQPNKTEATGSQDKGGSPGGALFKGKGEEDGRWVTMHGSPVFIRDGQSAEEAAKERFGGKKPTESSGGKSPKWSGPAKTPEEVGKRTAIMRMWAEKNDVGGAKDQAQVLRNMLRGDSLEEAVGKRNSRRESELRRNLGDETYEQMRKNGDIKPLPLKSFSSTTICQKSFSDSMSIEVDGAYVSPQLAGIPLRIRNERGRFDKRGVGRLRTSRDVMESLKAAKDDEDGRWVTMHGSPVFIRDGQSAEDAAKERFGPGGRPVRNSDEASDARAAKRETRKLNQTIADIKDKIAANERKIAAAKERGSAEVAKLQASLDSIKAKKDILAVEAKASDSRMEALRREWETKFPGKPLPKLARRKGAGASDLEGKIQAELLKQDEIAEKLKVLSEELDNL